MASTTSQKKYARNYYRKNSKYREEKIKQRSEDYQHHKKDEAKYQREYYRKKPSYRRYKIAYAAAYRKSHKEKKN